MRSNRNAQHKLASYMSRSISDISICSFFLMEKRDKLHPRFATITWMCLSVFYGRGSVHWPPHINQPWWENLKKQVEKRRDEKSDRKIRKVQARTHRRRRAGGPNQYDTDSTNHRRLTVLVCTLNRHWQPEILVKVHWSKLQENFFSRCVKWQLPMWKNSGNSTCDVKTTRRSA